MKPVRAGPAFFVRPPVLPTVASGHRKNVRAGCRLDQLPLGGRTRWRRRPELYLRNPGGGNGVGGGDGGTGRLAWTASIKSAAPI